MNNLGQHDFIVMTYYNLLLDDHLPFDSGVNLCTLLTGVLDQVILSVWPVPKFWVFEGRQLNKIRLKIPTRNRHLSQLAHYKKANTFYKITF